MDDPTKIWMRTGGTPIYPISGNPQMDHFFSVGFGPNFSAFKGGFLLV